MSGKPTYEDLIQRIIIQTSELLNVSGFIELLGKSWKYEYPIHDFW